MPSEWVQPQEITTYLQWITEKGGQPNTLRIYGGRLNHVAWWLKVHHDVGLLEATHDHLRDWRSGLRHGHRTIILYIRVVKAFYRWAHRYSLVAVDPAWNLPTPRYRRSVPRPIDTSPLIVAIENAPPMIRMCLVLGAFSGLRAAEVAGLRREDLQENAGRPYMVVEGKGGKERTVPLSPRVWEELQLHGLPPRGEIFRRRDGLPYTPAHLDQIINRFLHDMGIPETFHQLRHWFGTHGQEAVGDLRVVGEVMGHASQNTTAGYAKASEPKSREMVDAIQLDPWPTRLAHTRDDR